VEQAGEAGFGSGVKRSGEFLGERGDVFKMRAEWLPLSGGFGQAIALGVFGGVGLVNHAQWGGGVRMILLEG
jgi:hypothetical protein